MPAKGSHVQPYHKRSPGPGKGNVNAQRHGGEAAVKSVQRGEPFRGLAAKEEQRVKSDLETAGRGALVTEAAVRLHTAMRLYWHAVQSAAEAGDLKKLDAYCKRFGWLASATIRAWREVRHEQADVDAGLLVDAIAKAKEVSGEQDRDPAE